MGKAERDRERYLRETALNPRTIKYRQVEPLYLGEWVKWMGLQQHSLYFHQRLGPLTRSQLEPTMDVKELKLLDNWRHYCDLLIVGKDEVLIVEAGIRWGPEHFGKLLAYGYLFKLTPDFADVHDYPLRLIGVGALWDDIAWHLCQEYGIEPVLFRPWWLEEYLRTLEFRKSRPKAQMIHYLPSIGRKTPLPYSK
jgi:hypothetical protein